MKRQTRTFKPGDRVRLTAQFLRNTGQYLGDEPHARWTVVSVKSFSGSCPDLVRVDAPSSTAYSAEELAANPDLAYRGILACNLEMCR